MKVWVALCVCAVSLASFAGAELKNGASFALNDVPAELTV